MKRFKAGEIEISVRPLTRKEVKGLRAEGRDLFNFEPSKAEDTLDRVFEMVLSDEDRMALENQPYRVSVDAWQEIVGLTFGKEEERKNFDPSGPGTQTEKD
jgi:hypothetical protein